MQQNMEFGMTG